MKLILLPGMDGTGDLFKPLLATLPKDISECSQVIPLPPGSLSYRQYAEHIAATIEEPDVIVVAESFSGRIAYELLNLNEIGIKIRAIIFVASFIGRPSRLATMASWLPVTRLSNQLLPSGLMARLCFANRSYDGDVEAIKRSVNLAKPQDLKHRLALISTLTTVKQTYNIPVTYIRPASDYLVSTEAVTYVGKVFNNFEVKQVEGGHFIAQCNPKECAQIIAKTFYQYA